MQPNIFQEFANSQQYTLALAGILGVLGITLLIALRVLFRNELEEKRAEKDQKRFFKYMDYLSKK